MDAEDLFTTAERQTIVLHEFENLRAGSAEGYLPGYEHIKLYPGQSICEFYYTLYITILSFSYLWQMAILIH